MAEQVKVDIKTIEAKLDKNEKLTKDEEDFLLKSQEGPEGYKGTVPVKEEPQGQTPEEIKAAEDKAAADQKARDALIARAKAAGLPETSTENEIIAAEKKKTEADEDKDPLVKIERLLQENQEKTDEQIDLSKIDLTAREKAYFWQMRRDRKARQQAEAERDAARFELIKVKKEKPAGKPIEGEEDPLKGKDATDFITVADVQKILAKGQRKEEKPAGAGDIVNLPFVQAYIANCDAKMLAEVKDYEEVMELNDEIIRANPDYQKKVAEALIEGKDPARKMYELIKADAEFAKLFPAAQTRVKARKAKKPEEKEEPKAKTPEELQKEKEAKEAEEALEKNKDKPKTSGHAEGKDKIEGTDYTLEQITAMSDREFAKLPKKVREKYLEMYG